MDILENFVTKWSNWYINTNFFFQILIAIGMVYVFALGILSLLKKIILGLPKKIIFLIVFLMIILIIIYFATNK